MKKAVVADCKIIELPKVSSRAGSISIIDGIDAIPFHVSRMFWLYDIPAGEARGAHAHRKCHQFLVAVSGSFEVELDDGKNKTVVSLNRPFNGLHIPPGIWAHEMNFSAGAICLVLTSHAFNESDYIRDYSSYLEHIES